MSDSVCTSSRCFFLKLTGARAQDCTCRSTARTRFARATGRPRSCPLRVGWAQGEAAAPLIFGSWDSSLVPFWWQSQKGPCCLFLGGQKTHQPPRGPGGPWAPPGSRAAWARNGTEAKSPGPCTAAFVSHCSGRRGDGASWTGTRCSHQGGSPPRKHSLRRSTEAREKRGGP